MTCKWMARAHCRDLERGKGGGAGGAMGWAASGCPPHLVRLWRGLWLIAKDASSTVFFFNFHVPPLLFCIHASSLPSPFASASASPLSTFIRVFSTACVVAAD